MDRLVFVATLAAAIGSGLVAGTFFIFSVAIMPALGRRPVDEGMSAMKEINVVILNPLFLGVFIGTAVLCAVLSSIAFWQGNGSAQMAAGALTYILGSFVVTVAFNVPMNNALAAADPASPQGREVWNRYLRTWTFWNTIRAAASTLSTALLISGFAAW